MCLFECDDDKDGVPDSDRIIHDCNKAWDSMWTVYEEKGAVVEDLCNRNGNRYLTAGRGKKVESVKKGIIMLMKVGLNLDYVGQLLKCKMALLLKTWQINILTLPRLILQ